MNCLVTNPSFDSQTKDFLTTKVSALGSKCEVTEKMFKAIEKSDIVDHVLNWAKFKQNNELKKKGGAKKAKILGINKLDDANFAGVVESAEQFVRQNNFSILFEQKLLNAIESDRMWWNGLHILVLQTP